MKRILSLLLALILALNCMTITTMAASTNFEDVKVTDFFYEPVQWAYEEGITKGKTDTQFQPGEACTRAQIVTFLWRAKGSPEPSVKENAFTDVKENAYYYKAVLWAVEKGITTGRTETTFAPNESCTRAQAVTFMWRAAGKPELESEKTPFADVSGSAYYTDAVLWAVDQGITTGYKDGTFGPQKSCNRGQIVTFLYRDMKDSGEVDAPSDPEKPAIPEDSDCPDCDEGASGMTFSTEEQYQLSEAFSSLPLTFEATFTISKDQLPKGDTSAKIQGPEDVTSLLSADDKYNACAIYAIDNTGSPVVILRNKAYIVGGYETYTFDRVDVAIGDPVHMSIVLNFAERSISCYVDGNLAQTLTNIQTTQAFKQIQAPVVGGDLRNGNNTYFRGTIDSVALWSDIRTAEEIAADHTGAKDVADDALMAAFDLTLCETCRMNDLSSNGNDLKYIDLWMEKDEVEPVGEFDYSFAIVGDTQTLSYKYPEHMEKIYDWLLENQESQKIEYVLGLGDITERSKDWEWENAVSYINKLNNKIPYLLARGNHDFWDDMNRFLHNGYYEKTMDGMMEEREIIITEDSKTGAIETVTGDITNAYQLATIGGTDYLFMTLDFAPGDNMLEWAKEVIESHPDHRVVVITHAYMYRNGTTLSEGECCAPSWYPTGNGKPFPLAYYEEPWHVNDGDEIREKVFSQYENVLMVLSGHDPWQHIVYRQDTGVHGNTVTQMLINPQYVDLEQEPSGMVAMFYFSNNGDTLTVRYYSVSKDCYGSPLSQFTIDLT